MFPPKQQQTRADVGMVLCVPARYGKPPGRKTVGTRRGVVHAKRGVSRSMQQGGGPVHAKPRSLTCADFEYVF